MEAIKMNKDEIIKEFLSNAGKKGGSVKSERKAKASAENGRKGGRPKMYKQAEMLKIVGVRTMEELDQIGCWNGEYYTVDGMTITPQYKQIGEDEFELTGYKIDK
jgi:general stress protein YciG